MKVGSKKKAMSGDGDQEGEGASVRSVRGLAVGAAHMPINVYCHTRCNASVATSTDTNCSKCWLLSKY